jgi:KDO2-lipid IV(A) lauroyltransferase
MIRNARETIVKTAPTDKSGVLALVKALRRGEMVGVLPDQVPTMGAGEFTDFFGKPALTMTLARQLQQKTKANLLMGHCERVPGGFKVVFTEPDPSILEPETAIAGLNKSVERVINQSPSQYQWQYKRYRRQPEGLPKPYRF